MASSADASRIVTGSADKTVRFWDAASGARAPGPLGPRRGDLGVAILPDNKTVVSAGADNKVRVWKPGRRSGLRRASKGPSSPWPCTPNGSQVVTGSADKTVKVFDLNNGNVVRTLAGHGDAVRALAITKDGSKIVSGSARQDRQGLERRRTASSC